MIQVHPRAHPDRRALSIRVALASTEARAWARTAETTSLGDSIRLGASMSAWRVASIFSGAVMICTVFLVAWSR